MAEPPVLAGAVQASSMVVAVIVDAVRFVGASGTEATGVTLTAFDAAPAPCSVTARNRIEYGVPFVRPVIVTGDVESSGDTADQFVPSNEYS